MSEFQHGTLSPWGYIYDAETLPELITLGEFGNYTNLKYGLSDLRIAPNIASSSSAIRNYCGWHVAPSLECGMIYNVRDLRDAFVGGDLLIQLPATFVTGVSKVIFNAVMNSGTGYYEGDEVTDDRIDSGMGDGLVRIYDVDNLDRKSKVFIKYTAGFSSSAIPDIKEICAAGVTHALTNTYGVNSEAAGGVSVSYNSVITGRGSTTLPSDARATLDAYKVRGVF